jgi:hypothetical protein
MAAAAMKWVRELSLNAAHVVGIHRVMAALVVIKSVWLAASSFHWFVHAMFFKPLLSLSNNMYLLDGSRACVDAWVQVLAEVDRLQQLVDVFDVHCSVH